MTGTATALEPVTLVSALAESAGVLRAALEAAPTDGQDRQARRKERLHAYLAFQQAAHAASVWPAWFGVLEQMVRGKEVTASQILPQLAAARDSSADLLAALSQIRLVGNPEPRRIAEAIVTLLVELMEQRIPGVPEHSMRISAVKWLYGKIDHEKGLELIEQRFPGFAGFIAEGKALIDDDTRKAQADRFNDCLVALGAWHKKFTLAARKDLGYGPRRWQVGRKPRNGRWQIWRPGDEWPGGWPPPEADELIEQARSDRKARAAEGQPVPGSSEAH
jgi:hypothetical protein